MVLTADCYAWCMLLIWKRRLTSTEVTFSRSPPPPAPPPLPSPRYEDYLDKQITNTDMYYLEDVELARQVRSILIISVIILFKNGRQTSPPPWASGATARP